MILSPKEIYLRRWWWSKQPFWQYLDADFRGWANLVDKHPGLFNLAWAMAGVSAPPKDYVPYSASITWVFTEAMYIPLKGKAMADWAFTLELEEFTALLAKSKREVCRWKFHDKHVSYGSIMQALGTSCSLRA